VSVALDFPRQISAVEDWRFLDLSRTGSRRRILGSVPQFLCRSVQSINRLIGPAARIVSARGNLLACFGYGQVAIFLRHFLLLGWANPLASLPFPRCPRPGPFQSERNLIHRIDSHGGRGHPKVESCPNSAPDGSDAEALALPWPFSETLHRHSGQGAEFQQAFSRSRGPRWRLSVFEAI
jgi:hypothetical protein